MHSYKDQNEDLDNWRDQMRKREDFEEEHMEAVMEQLKVDRSEKVDNIAAEWEQEIEHRRRNSLDGWDEVEHAKAKVDDHLDHIQHEDNSEEVEKIRKQYEAEFGIRRNKEDSIGHHEVLNELDNFQAVLDSVMESKEDEHDEDILAKANALAGGAIRTGVMNDELNPELARQQSKFGAKSPTMSPLMSPIGSRMASRRGSFDGLSKTFRARANSRRWY